MWEPELFFDGGKCPAKRRPGRPNKRWKDDLDEFLHARGHTTPWHILVLDYNIWEAMKDAYCTGVWYENVA